MKWKVENALSRDVERQHLNKILKEIEAAISSSSSGGITEAEVRAIVAASIPPAPRPPSYTLSLQGDVSGTATLGAGNTILPTTLEVDVLEEAPLDGYTYWRTAGEWAVVPEQLSTITNLDGPGFPALDELNQWHTRVFEAVAGELTVVEADGATGNVLYGLADVGDTEVGEAPVKLYTKDAKGRIVGEEDADTDSLPEGSTNLYHTDERAQDAVGNILADSADIVFDYDDATPEITAELHPDVWDAINSAVQLTGVPSDADIIEFDSIAGGWVPKKNPRELLLDGGNF